MTAAQLLRLQRFWFSCQWRSRRKPLIPKPRPLMSSTKRQARSLLSKNADIPLPPASMSKLMTIYMAFEAVADGRLRIDEALPVSIAFRGLRRQLDVSGHDRPCERRRPTARRDRAVGQ